MASKEDVRNIVKGDGIFTTSYSDQPYIVKTDDGAWLCCITTAYAQEGDKSQHIISMRSADLGKSWSSPVNVEPSDGAEASYAVMFKIPSGRIYIFYNHNTDNIRRVKADAGPWAPDGYFSRVDSLGYFVFKYSDDHGKSWSKKRHPIPIREFDCDRDNNDGGKIRYFWNVGKPFAHDGCVYVPHTKVGRMGSGFFAQNEGVLLKSANILSEPDPGKIIWETLPDGDVGLKTPPGGGPIAAEQSFSVLSDGSFFCVYRTIDGYPVFSYSRDGGHSWDIPEYMRYADGRLVKHPRAANFAWKCANGKYLYWYHNHGGRFIREMLNAAAGSNGLSRFNVCTPYDDRNPVWLCGGVEADSPAGKVIKWSQPEIVLYDDNPYIRISYPDMIEVNGRIFLSETQKREARIHEINQKLLESLWTQQDAAAEVAKEGLVLDLPGEDDRIPNQYAMPRLPVFNKRGVENESIDLRQSFAVDLWMKLGSLAGGQVLVDNRTDPGQGFCLQTTNRGTVEITLDDGRTENRWECDQDCLGNKSAHHLAVVVDGGPKIISFIVDGRFCDGADFRQFGWGRFSPNLRDVNGSGMIRISPCVKKLRVYGRLLSTSEAIGNFKAEKSEYSN